jgi:hypothetical protein
MICVTRARETPSRRAISARDATSPSSSCLAVVELLELRNVGQILRTPDRALVRDEVFSSDRRDDHSVERDVNAPLPSALECHSGDIGENVRAFR